MQGLFSKQRRPLLAWVFALFGLAALPQSAAAQNGNVDVDINLTGGITILYYYSDIDVTIPVADLFNAASNCVAPATTTTVGTATGASGCIVASPAAAVTATGSATAGLTAPFAAIAGGTANLSAVNLTLSNVWAVRALGGTTASTTMGVVVPAATTITNGTSSIGVTGATITPATFTDPGLVNPQNGDIRLTLNFANTTTNGNHDSGADTGNTVYTIQVTGT